MRTTLVLAATVSLLATAATARADCIDQLHCICPAVANASATGVIESVRTETSANGFSIDIGELRIDRLSLRDETDTRFFEGQLVDISLLSSTGVGDRVVASAHPGDDGFSVLGKVQDGSIGCSAAFFGEDEARELVVMDDCRERAREKIEITPCNDTFPGCSVGGRGSAPWWLVGLGVAALGLSRRSVCGSRRGHGSSQLVD